MQQASSKNQENGVPEPQVIRSLEQLQALVAKGQAEEVQASIDAVVPGRTVTDTQPTPVNPLADFHGAQRFADAMVLIEATAKAHSVAIADENARDETPRRAPLRQRLRYRFDTFMARGGSSIFISLVLVFLALLLVFSIARGVLLFSAPDAQLERGPGFLHNTYVTFLQMTDPGNMNQDVESSPMFKVSAIFAGLSGVVMLSTLVAFITTAMDQKISQLKKGHSKVIESNHTLILGWNERVVEILRELVLANESEDDPVVVILANEDKEVMDEHLRLSMPNTLNTRVVTRSGSPSSLLNLEIASVSNCKSVIVLARCPVSSKPREKEASDAMVIKTVLALVAARPADSSLNIVAEIFLPGNRRLVEEISPREVTTVDTDDILAKILVQTSRSVGLSVVYNEVLSFDGCEMYFHEDDWGAKRFGELAFYFPDGVPMGLRHSDGRITLNPPIDLAVKPDDAVLILAEDDSTIDFQPRPLILPRELSIVDRRKEQLTEHNLVIGWTSKVETILREYADYVLEGSTVDVMLRQPDQSVVAKVEALNDELDGMQVRLIDGNPLTREGLAEVHPYQYDNIIILSQGQIDDDDETTESETIVILLLLRGILENAPEMSHRTKLITEVLDSDNQSLVARAGVRDFIISNRFISMLLAQISEDPDIKHVYDDLFDEDGSEIYLKPVSLYFDSFPVELNYADMIFAAQQREEVCLGVKIKALENEMDENFGVKLIPEKHVMYTLSAEDSLVVLAEDES